MTAVVVFVILAALLVMLVAAIPGWLREVDEMPDWDDFD